MCVLEITIKVKRKKTFCLVKCHTDLARWQTQSMFQQMAPNAKNKQTANGTPI